MITDELREWFKDRLFMGNGYAELTAIADRIDEEHQKAIRELNNLADASVLLPVGADGEPIRVGDVVIAQLLFGGESKPLVVDRMELSHGRDGDLWCVALDTDKECWNQPSILRHHHPPTVEGVLREFAQAMNENMGMYTGEAIDADEWRDADTKTIAEYAKRLRLAGEDA